MHNCVFTCIKILPHYDEYGCVHYETSYEHHVHHDDTMVFIPFECLAIVSQQLLVRPAGPRGV